MHPVKINILSAHTITVYTVDIFLVSQGIVNVRLDLSEKCTAYMVRVTEASSCGCRNNWKDSMRHLDGKGRRKYGNSKLWNGKVAKILCCPNGNSDIQEGVNQSRKDDSVEEKAMLSSTTMGHVHPTQLNFSAGYSLQRAL